MAIVMMKTTFKIAILMVLTAVELIPILDINIVQNVYVTIKSIVQLDMNIHWLEMAYAMMKQTT